MKAIRKTIRSASPSPTARFPTANMRWMCPVAGTAIWPSCKTRPKAKCRRPSGMCGGGMTACTTDGMTNDHHPLPDVRGHGRSGDEFLSATFPRLDHRQHHPLWCRGTGTRGFGDAGHHVAAGAETVLLRQSGKACLHLHAIHLADGGLC